MWLGPTISGQRFIQKAMTEISDGVEKAPTEDVREAWLMPGLKRGRPCDELEMFVQPGNKEVLGKEVDMSKSCRASQGQIAVA